MILGIDPKVDYAFKLLLGREETQALLIDVLNCVLDRPEGGRVESVQILNPFNPKAAWDDKLSVVDVRARDQRGRWFNVEMQVLGTPLIMKALRELEMLTQDEIQRIRYEDRLESQRAYKTDMRLSKLEGKLEGELKGRKIGAIQTLERLLGRPESPAEQFSGLAPEELDRMAADLERQFREAR